MDTTKTTSHIGLCAGYGGIELGLKRVIPNLRSVALCEIEAFACANLVAKMEAGLLDPAPIWTNLKTFFWGAFRDRVDVLSGGYPCQPFSAAGRRLGKDDPRHLWPWIADGIRAMRPRVCFFENVEGHISLGLREVVEELEGLGYQATWGIFSASEVGAPHQRKRVFILAHLKCSGLERMLQDIASQGRQAERGFVARCCQHRGDAWPSGPGQPQHGWEPPRVVGDSNRLNWRTQTEGRQHDTKAGSTSEGVGDSRGEILEGSERKELQRKCNRSANASGGHPTDWQTQPSLGGDVDGSADWMDNAELYESCDNRTDELRLLGNGVVPATAEKAFRVLLDKLMGRS